MDSNPTSNTPAEHKTTVDQPSARKLSISSQVREFYSYSDAQVSAKPQSKSLPTGPTKSFKEDIWARANAFHSLTDVAGPEYCLPKQRSRDYGTSHHGAESASKSEEIRHGSNSKVHVEQGDYSDRAKSLNQLEAESRHINEVVKAALQASLDTSGPRVPSPASSIASNKRGLEWDSGADVGYQYEQRDSSHLSIIERLALARGSAAFQLGSSGTGSLSKSGDMSISLNQKDAVKAVSKSLASLEIALASNSSQARAISEPLAQSTPQEADRRSLILAAAAAEDDISPLQSSKEQRGSSKFPTMKSLSATDLCLQEDVETTIVHCRRKSDTNISLEKDAYSSYKPTEPRSKTSVKQSTHNTRDQTVQTSETVPIVKQSSIGVQAGERSDTDKKSRNGSSSSSDKSLNKVSLADAERFIAQIQRNASEHQKVIDKIKQKNLGVAKSTGAIKKSDYCAPSASRGPNRERSSSSSDFNETPFSVNVTNEHGTIGSANSFEYLPGDVYETANARQLQSPVARTSSDAIAWGVESNTLARDLEDGVQNFKALLGNRKEIDPQTKDQLIKRLVRKLIETDYQDDAESSTTGASVVYVPNRPADDLDGSDRNSARRRHRPISPTSDRGDSRSVSHRFGAASSSGRSSLPSPRGSASTSSTTTLETRDWRAALTQSEKRRQPDKRDDELAQISRKIHQLNKLKHLLEREDYGARPPSPNVYTVMTMLGVSSDDSARVVESSADDSARVAESSADENWSSHHRMGPTRNVTTQFPSGVRLTDRATSSTTTTASESWDSSLDHRARHGRINVFVQTSGREADSRRSAEKQASVDPLCCCQCERKLTKLMEMSKSPSVSCRCGCHARRPTPAQESSTSSTQSSCVCVETPQPSRRDVRLADAATSTTSNDAKAVQTSDSVAALPIIQPRWFPSGSHRESTQKKQVCQCCGNEKEARSAKVLSESTGSSNVSRAAENCPCRCAVCLRESRFCACEGGNRVWDVSAISGKGLAPQRQANVSTKSRATETDAPRPLGYVLTFETPSTSEGSTAEPPPRPPLREVRMKAARRGRPSTKNEPEHKRSSVEVPMQTSTPSTESVSEVRSRIGSSDSARKPAAGSKASVSSARPTLQDYLRSNRPDYIETAELRRQCLSELAHLRELRLQSRQKLLALASAPGKCAEALSSLPPPPLATKRVFSQRTMLRQTRRLHQRTEEVGKKRSELKRKEDYRTNRLMAEMFARKLQKNVLKGSVNLSNSKSVI